MIKRTVLSLNKTGKIQKVGHCFLPSGTTSQAKARWAAGGLLLPILKNDMVSPSAITVVSKTSCKVMQTDDKSTLRERAGVCHAVKTHLTKVKLSMLKERLNG